jgi:dethiobiotin synthetase
MADDKERFTLPRRLFITGTGTDVGKTILAAILMAGLRGVYWKPVQSGLETATDTQWIQQATGLPEHHFHPERHRLRRPLSPHASAALDEVRIELADFRAPDPEPRDHLIVEGAGGVLVPLNDRHFMLDLIFQLGLPVLLVASSRLGTINHTLLTMNALRSRRVPVIGVVLNGPLDESNRVAIEHYGQIPVVAEIEPLPTFDAAALESVFARHFAPTAR